MKFSQRIGARPLLESGLEEATPALRTALWNIVHSTVVPQAHDSIGIQGVRARGRSIWAHLGWRTDELPEHPFYIRETLSQYWFGCEWPEFFDLVEYVAQLPYPGGGEARRQWYSILNNVLESQGCAYRFIAEALAPITNPTEFAEVTSAANSAIPAVASHIREALNFLPPSTDVSPRNSVKESISAVEAALKNLSNDASATLTSGLSAFEAKYGELHPALRAGLVKLYGYTSDEKGVRHALVDGTADVTTNDARFMVVICSAFANYLVTLAA
jgi:hypothetical protein